MPTPSIELSHGAGDLQRLVQVLELRFTDTAEPDPDVDSLYEKSRSHHVAGGRWLGARTGTAEFYSADQPRAEDGRWTRYGGRGFAPVASAAAGALAYRRTAGIKRRVPSAETLADTVVDPAARAKAARTYANMPVFDEKALPAYHKLASEIETQHKFITDKLGIKIEVTTEDPYPDVASMVRDINENGRLAVMSTATTGSHPFFTDHQNDMFRAVHDFFGHAATGRDFSRHGERAAYLEHASMMKSKDSIRALFTETEMQNAALIATGQFQEQKVALAPDEMVFHGL